MFLLKDSARRSQHQCDVKKKKSMNAFYSHLRPRRNKEHIIEWEGCVYLDRENWTKRKIKEAVYIN